MAYIYKIVNDINNKVYIGKTDFSIEKRFKEHCRDAFRRDYEKRPLYSAMKKYGIEHFRIELIEETNNPDEREIFWIENYGSFKNGYNATKGGDGKHYADYDLIYNLWDKEKLNITQIQKLTNYDRETIRKALNSHHVSEEERKKYVGKAQQKPVARIDKDTNEILEILPSVAEAEKKYNTNKHIGQVCKGNRKTAGGFKWKYIE